MCDAVTEPFTLTFNNKSIVTTATVSDLASVNLLGLPSTLELGVLNSESAQARRVHATWHDKQLIDEKNEGPTLETHAPPETVHAQEKPDSEFLLLQEKHEATLTKLLKHLQDKPDLLAQLRAALNEYKDVWWKPRHGLAKAHAVSFQVQGKPFKARLRVYSPDEQEEMKKHIDTGLASGVMRPSKSDWAAAPHFVMKKTGEKRMVINYTELNKCMIADAYPIPLVWDNLRRCAGKKYYITLDMFAGFWNVPLEEGSKKYTAFITPFGTYEFNVIPFGIKNSPTTFQRAVDRCLEGLLGEHVLVYIDDIVIFADDFDILIEYLKKVLDAMRRHGFFIRLDKSSFVDEEVPLLGHMVGRHGIRPAEKKLKAIENAAVPKDSKALHSFLGVAGYLRPYVPNFADLAQPLHAHLVATRKAGWSWPENLEKAFTELKTKIADHLRLGFPKPEGQYIIETDASNLGVGALLKQFQEDKEVILECASLKFTDTQSRWDTRERELYAIVWAVERWRHYVGLTHFVVRTDHNNLRYLARVDRGKVFRWALFLAQYNMTVEFKSGESNVLADWLSRHACMDDNDDTLIDLIAVPVYATTRGAKPPTKLLTPSAPKLADYITEWEKMPKDELEKHAMREGTLWVHPFNRRIFVPPTLRSRLLGAYHFGASGHLGVQRTLRRLRQLFYWPKMAEDVAAFIAGCLICCRLKNLPSDFKRQDLGHLDAPQALDIVSLDHVIIPFDGKENRKILVIIDHATRYLAAGYVPDMTALTTFETFARLWMVPFGLPRVVLTDNGTAFHKEFHTQVLRLGCQHLYSSPYHPQGNGINEASHKGLKSVLAAAWQEGTDNLGGSLNLAVHIHNTTPHVGLRTTPYEALFGRSPHLFGLQEFAIHSSEEERRVNLLARRREHFRKVLLRDRQLEANEPEEILPGDLVVARVQLHGATGTCLDARDLKWLTPAWTLPMTVAEVGRTQVLVHPYGDPKAKRIKVHRSDVRKFEMSPIPLLKELTEQYIQMKCVDPAEFTFLDTEEKPSPPSPPPAQKKRKVRPYLIDRTDSTSP